MTIHLLRDRPTEVMAKALADFESRFTYPLGPGRSFQISHGDDYPRFFRAMGDAACFIAEEGGSVVGVIGIAIRTLICPDREAIKAAYIGDLKVDPAARASRAFLRLGQAADAWARPQVKAAYGVVMDGTRVAPDRYTGRMGIEAFKAVGKVVVVRLSTLKDLDRPKAIIDPETGPGLFATIDRNRYTSTGGDAAERSEMEPLWLCHPDGTACGRLEDTRKAKRLIDSSGVEIRCGHLTCFAWSSVAAAVDLIQSARWYAGQRGVDGLFVAVPEQDLNRLGRAFESSDSLIAPATVYAAALRPGGVWNINSSEI